MFDKETLSTSIVNLVVSRTSGSRSDELGGLIDLYKTKFGHKSLFRDVFVKNHRDIKSLGARIELLDLCFYKEHYIGKSEKNGYYPYISFSRKVEFCNLLKFFLKNFSGMNSFVDVGAGIGDKVLLARMCGFKKVRGIEVSPLTSEMGNLLLKSVRIKIENIDVFEIESLKDDLIYIYHPIQDDTLYTKLLLHLMKIMKQGSRLIEVLPRGRLWDNFDRIDRERNGPRSRGFPVLQKVYGGFNLNFLDIEDGSLRSYSERNFISDKTILNLQTEK